MKHKKPSILICSVDKIDEGAIQTITKAFIEGLQSHYNFIPFYINRRYGKTTKSNFNLINIYYFFKHLTLWIYKLIIYKPDIAHYPITSYWNLEKSLLFLKIAGVFGAKKVGHLHGGSFDKFWSKILGKRKKFALKCLNSLDCLIVLSKYWESFMKEDININICVVYNPIDKYFEEETISNDIENKKNLLFVGSVGRRKGIYDIVECANRLKRKIDFKINIVGSEEEPNSMIKVNNLIDRYNLQKYIKVLGPLYGQKKVNIFKECAIFLFPSYNENFPLVIIEAAVAGLAIITTPVGALPEFFEHNKSVIFVEPGNVEQIAEAIIELINDDEKRILLGKAAREVFIKKLVKKRILESLDNIYQSVLRNI